MQISTGREGKRNDFPVEWLKLGLLEKLTTTNSRICSLLEIERTLRNKRIKKLYGTHWAAVFSNDSISDSPSPQLPADERNLISPQRSSHSGGTGPQVLRRRTTYLPISPYPIHHHTAMALLSSVYLPCWGHGASYKSPIDLNGLQPSPPAICFTLSGMSRPFMVR